MFFKAMLRITCAGAEGEAVFDMSEIADTIGNTPVVKLHRLAPKHVTIYVKIEAFNPLGSVKDRLANVERIVTDSSHSLDREIEALRGGKSN